MGRHRLHTEATAAALVDAAERIVESHGEQSLTVRRLADDLGTTTRAVYSTLGSKPALLEALGVRAFDMLAAMVDALPLTADPAADLVAAGTYGFRRFAREHPALFRVGIQQIAVSSEVANRIYPAAARALVTLHRRIDRLSEAGLVGGRSLADATWEFHAACEGLAAVELRGIIHADDGERLWNDALESLVAGWRSR
jgi:AcrR family transcriptional regulator